MVEVFFGTPRRFLATLAGIGLVVAAINPALLHRAVERLLAAAMPLVGPALGVVIVLLVLKTMLSRLK